VESNLGLIVFGLVVVEVILVALVAAQSVRVNRLRRRLQGITRGEDGRSLEAILDAHFDRVGGVARELDELTARTAILEAIGRRSLQHIGIVRFNPFGDTGGNQSFALAMLDSAGDGFVLSSLHARAGTRVYAKAVAGGRAESALSDEESEALRRALARPADRTRPAA
jgi:hypothetical protein